MPAVLTLNSSLDHDDVSLNMMKAVRNYKLVVGKASLG